MKIITLANAKKNLYSLIEQVISNSQPIEILNTKEENENVVMISKKDWDALQETIYLQNTGILDQIQRFSNEESEALDKINWDSM